MKTSIRLVLAALLFTISPLLTQAQDRVEAKDEVDSSWYEIENISGRKDVGDFVVGPGRSEIEVQPGQSVTQYITVTNRISDNREFRLEVEDIAGTQNGSAAVRVLNEGEQSPYSIRDYITFAEDTFTLDLGERAKIPVTIDIPASAEPGGYYGSVLVSTVRSGQSPDGASRNPIIARVGSYFFVTVPGERLQSGSFFDLSVLPTQWWYESGPITLALVYENSGSVHVNPYGELRIYNTFGSEVGYQEIDPWFVLPTSIRSREVEWSREFLFGRYVAEASINRGYDDIIDTQSVAFWVLPWRFLAIVALSTFLIGFLIRLFFSSFELSRKS